LALLGVALGLQERAAGLGPKLLVKFDDFVAELLLPEFQPGDRLLGAAGRLLGQDIPVGADDRVSQLGSSLRCRIQDLDGDHVSTRSRLDRHPVPHVLGSQSVATESGGSIKHRRRGEVFRLGTDDAARFGLLTRIQEQAHNALIADGLPRRPRVGEQPADEHGHDHEPPIAPGRLDEAWPLLPVAC
jgi:hypothetical protein